MDIQMNSAGMENVLPVKKSIWSGWFMTGIIIFIVVLGFIVVDFIILQKINDQATLSESKIADINSQISDLSSKISSLESKNSLLNNNIGNQNRPIDNVVATSTLQARPVGGVGATGTAPKGKCGDGVCDPREKADPALCPADCK
jgi:outer membrane murein-binding lipoprotein Lpp